MASFSLPKTLRASVLAMNLQKGRNSQIKTGVRQDKCIGITTELLYMLFYHKEATALTVTQNHGWWTTQATSFALQKSNS